MKFLTEILKIKGDWQEVVDDCRATVGKIELSKEPSKRFKIGILIAEHTPIVDADGKPYPKSEQVARCGNAVCPPIPTALVRANLPELCRH